MSNLQDDQKTREPQRHYESHSGGNDPQPQGIAPRTRIYTIDVTEPAFERIRENEEPTEYEIRRTDRWSMATYDGDLKHQLLKSTVHVLMSKRDKLKKDMDLAITQAVKGLQEYENELK